MNFQALKLQISQAIEEQNFSILEVEKKAGIPRDTLRNFLNGRVKEPKLETIKAASRMLNLNINEHFLNHKSNEQEALGDPCDLDLLEKCFLATKHYLASENKNLNLTKLVVYLKKIYQYHKDYASENINASFIAWCIDNDKD